MISPPFFLLRPPIVAAELSGFVLLLVLSAVVPQATEGKVALLAALQARHPLLYQILDLLDLVRIRTSPLFLAILGLIAASLTAMVGRQAGSLIRRRRRHLPAAEDVRTLPGISTAGRPWGTLLLHLGLLLVTTAGCLNFLFLQRGYLQLMEGETFHGSEQEFAAVETGILRPGFAPGVTIRLDDVGVEYWETGQLRELASRLTVFPPGGKGHTARVAVNAPLSLAGLRVHQAFSHGYALSLVLQDRAGVAARTFFLLDAPDRPGRAARTRTTFPASPYRLALQFFPDVSGRSLHPRAPLLSLKVFRGRTVVFDGLLLPGQQAPLGDEAVTVRFEGFRRWSGLIVQRQPDRWPAYAGLLLCVLGAALLFCPGPSRATSRRSP